MYDFEKSESILHNRKKEDLKVSNIEELLERDYPEILESIKDEEYAPLYENFDEFIEIIDDNKTVGYITLENLKTIYNQHSINDAYILPEYRNKGLFTSYLTLLLLEPNRRIHFKKPSIQFVNYLIDHNFAITLNNNLVFSYIEFVTDGHDVFKNKNLKRYYKSIPSENDDIHFVATVFDLNMGCFYFPDEENIFVKKEYPGISMPHPYDLKKYKLRKKLHKINSSYMVNVIKNLKYHDKEVQDFDREKKEELEESLTMENILGTEDNLNPDYIEFIRKHNLSEEDARKIYDKLREALDFEEIVPRTIFRRLSYLIEHPEAMAIVTDTSDTADCPYCGGKLLIMDTYCDNCGFNIESIDDEEFIEDDISYEDMSKDELFDGLFDEMEFNNIYYDKESRLFREFHEEVTEDGFDPKIVYQQQLDAGVYAFLSFINNEEQELLIPEYDDKYGILPGSIIQKTLEDNLAVEVDKKINMDDVERFLKDVNDEEKDDVLKKIKTEPSYQITQKGKQYLENTILKEYYEKSRYLPYYEFKHFYDKEEHTSIDSFILRFLDEMTLKAIQQQDIHLYLNALYEKVNYYIRNNTMELVLIYLLRALICRINQYKQLHVEQYEIFKAIDIREELYISQLIGFLSEYNVDELFNQAYDGIKIKALKVDKKQNRDYIDYMINVDDIESINKYIREN